MFINHIGDSCPVPGDTHVRVLVEGDPHPYSGVASEFGWGLRDAPGRIESYEVLVAQAGVGDVTSNERGSGARFNANKPDLSLIPAGILAKSLSMSAPWVPGSKVDWPTVLHHLGTFQMRPGANPATALYMALLEMDVDGRLWADCARVFEYGKIKYAAWNWAKGMQWSIPLACALRHIIFGTTAGEEIDPESGLPHRGHIACNIVMLLWFLDEYPGGNDLPRFAVS